MKLEEYIKQILDNDSVLLNKISKDHLFTVSENIKQIRDLIKSFVFISSGIIGFTIPVFGRVDLIKNSLFLTGALSELLIVILYGFFYLTYILQKENKELEKLFREYLDFLDIPKEARNKFISIPTKENHEAYQKRMDEVVEKINSRDKIRQKADHTLDIIYFAFFVALLLIVLSMINISL